MSLKIQQIDPESLFSIEEACALIPGRRGKCIHPQTLTGWIRRGKIAARKVGSLRFIRGDEINRILGESD